jgi:hypothetical protein
MKIKDTKFTRIALIIFTITAITVFGIQAFATPIPGTVISDTLVVGDTGYTFALADSNYLKGGHMQVADRAALLNTGTDRTVTLERRSVGMLVTVLDDDLGTAGNQTVTYRLFTNPSTPTTAITDWRVVLPDSIDGYNSGTNKYLTADASGNYSWGTPSATAGMIMTWPTSAGIALYNGANDWGTSITDNSANWNTAYGWGNHANAGYLVSTSSAANMTNFPTFNQDTTGNAGGLTSAFIDWNALSGGASILNKPIISGSNTGDETTLSIKNKLGFASATTDGYLTSTDWTNFNSVSGSFDGTRLVTRPSLTGVTGTALGGTTLKAFVENYFFPYVAPSGNITATNTATTITREVGDTSNISVAWSVGKSAADSNGNSFYVYGASSISPSNATFFSGTQPSSLSGGVASGSGTVTYSANGSAYNTLNGTASFTFTAYPCSALAAAAGACTQSSGAGSVASGVNPPNVVASATTVVYRSKVFYGSSTQADGTLVDLTTLTSVALASSTTRTSIGTQTFNLSGGNYIYFAWPQAFDPGGNCLYSGGGSVNCFHTPLGDVANFVRTTQTRNGIPYYVYRSYDINPSATYTIQ